MKRFGIVSMIPLGLVVVMWVLLSGCTFSVLLQIESHLPDSCEIWDRTRVVELRAGKKATFVYPQNRSLMETISLVYHGKRYYYDWDVPLGKNLQGRDRVVAKLLSPEDVQVLPPKPRGTKPLPSDGTAIRLRVSRIEPVEKGGTAP